MSELEVLIDKSQYLYANRIYEPHDTALIVEIAQGHTNSSLKNNALEMLVTTISSIEVNKDSLRFKLEWPTYVAYNVMNECFVCVDNNEVYKGKFYRRYSKSAYLDFISISTFCSDEYPGILKHWRIICLNHEIDVISHLEPEISLIK